MIKKYFAKLDENNIVTQIDVINIEDSATEEDGINFLRNFYKDFDSVWKMTDKKTKCNKHKDGDTPFRGNYAGVNSTYDQINDMFFPPKPYDSWIKDIENANWKSTVEYPTITTYEDSTESDNNGNPKIMDYAIFWDENNLRWIALKADSEEFYWDVDNSTWNEI